MSGIGAQTSAPSAMPSDVQTSVFSSLEDIFLPPAGMFQIRVFMDGVPFEFLMKRRQQARYLIVFGQSALSSRSAFPLPIYHRWTWFDDFPEASCIALNDPTLYKGDSLLGGWFQGSPQRFYMEDGAQLIGSLAAQLGIPNDRVFFYGSSAGGFSSLMMAGLLKGATAIAEIPQTDMRKYHVKSALDNLLHCCYDGMSMEDASNKYAYRLSVVELYKILDYVPNIVYLQNVADSIHMKNHMVPLLEGIESLLGKSKSRFLMEMYSNRTASGDGHVAAPRGTVGRIIRDALKVFGGP